MDDLFKDEKSLIKQIKMKIVALNVCMITFMLGYSLFQIFGFKKIFHNNWDLFNEI